MTDNKILKMEVDYSTEVEKWINDIKSNTSINEALDKLYVCEKLTRLVGCFQEIFSV